MSFTGWVTAVLALALAAGSAAAQVTVPVAPPEKPAVVEPETAPAPAEVPPAHVSAVPEPGSILLLAAPAAAGWVAYWRRKWRVEPAKSDSGTNA
jgi:PEP-CTERM motif